MFWATVKCGKRPASWMTYPIPRRRRMGSQSEVARPWTRTWPEAGSRRRLISFNSVVLPLPLRPRRTRVSLGATVSDMLLTIVWSTVPLILYVTLRNWMVGSAIAGAVFAFIWVDTPRLGRTS